MKPPMPADMPSPCISVCRMQSDGFCEGCQRTLDEIARWGTMSPLEKRAVWKALPGRRAAIDNKTHDASSP